MYKYLIAAVLAVSTCGSAPAFAQVVMCFDREEIIAPIESAGYSLIFTALYESMEETLEIYVHDDGNWLSFSSFPDGRICPTGTGEHYKISKQKPNA